MAREKLQLHVPATRPRLEHWTPENVRARFDEYFEECRNHGITPVIRGLAITALGITMEELTDREHGKTGEGTDKVGIIREIRRAKEVVRDWIDLALANGTAGASLIFYSKNALGYRETQDINVNQSTTITISHELPVDIYQGLSFSREAQGLQEGDTDTFEALPMVDNGGE